ncbi:MAG: hypothetical protein EDM05_004970 [Leptolyngbya sp. IPPAS B-1204]|nr:hypothetical protein [Elainella sp. C42_A2020_010]RNJ65498.1 MAG: hypothetical protein EDM05_30880 [Leptolyngbya sp. IPPAS B-1204]
MNASEQATNVEIVSKIATVVNLVRFEFPDLAVDFSPWLNNAETQKFDDPNSIDLGFHFPGRSFACQSSSILMQIRLPDAQRSRIAAVELSGHDHMGQQWRFATSQAEEFWGLAVPLPKAQTQLKQICRQVVRLFNSAVRS